MQEHVHFLYFYNCFADIPCFFSRASEINCWGGRDRKISALVSAPVSALYLTLVPRAGQLFLTGLIRFGQKSSIKGNTSISM